MDEKALTGYAPSEDGIVEAVPWNGSLSMDVSRRDLPLRIIFEGYAFVIEAAGDGLTMKRL